VEEETGIARSIEVVAQTSSPYETETFTAELTEFAERGSRIE